MLAGRRRLATDLLRRAGVFPEPDTPCLEVGYGRLGWLGDLISWGVRESRLCGIELDAVRAAEARDRLPAADLRVGDARELPWADGDFQLVIASTVFTSVLEGDLRQRLAAEMVRVLRPGGALLWYDFRADNPRNPNVRGIGRRQLRGLFPELAGEIRSATLAPPLTRLIAPRNHLLATVFEALPFLRSHLVAVLVKRGPE